MGTFKAHFLSDHETIDADYFCHSVPNLQRMKSELQQLAELCSVQMPYRSKAGPDAALDPASFAQPIADTLSQMYHYRSHVFDLTQAFDDAIHWTVVLWSQKHAGSFKPLVDYVQIQTWAQKVLPEKVLALRSPCKMVKEAIYRKALLRSGGGFHWALAVCIGIGFRLQYL